jgi:hypothetical protein
MTLHRLVHLVSNAIFAVVGLATLGYLAFGPMNCDATGDCYGMLDSRDAPFTGGFLAVLAVALVLGIAGSYVHDVRNHVLGQVLEWLTVLLLVLDRFYPPVPLVGAYLGYPLLPTAAAALSAAITGALARGARLTGQRPAAFGTRRIERLALAVATTVGLLVVGMPILWALEYPLLGAFAWLLR